MLCCGTSGCNRCLYINVVAAFLSDSSDNPHGFLRPPYGIVTNGMEGSLLSRRNHQNAGHIQESSGILTFLLAIAFTQNIEQFCSWNSLKCSTTGALRKLGIVSEKAWHCQAGAQTTPPWIHLLRTCPRYYSSRTVTYTEKDRFKRRKTQTFSYSSNLSATFSSKGANLSATLQTFTPSRPGVLPPSLLTSAASFLAASACLGSEGMA